MVKRKDMMDTPDVLELLGITLLGVIPEDEGVIISTNRGEPAVLAPKSTAGKAFQDAARCWAKMFPTRQTGGRRGSCRGCSGYSARWNAVGCLRPLSAV